MPPDRVTAVGGVSYGYDNNGNLTSRGSDSFSWDAEDRLTSTTVNSTTTSFAYDGDGLRASRGSTDFVWDVNQLIPQVLDDETADYVYGNSRIAVLKPAGAEGSGTYYYLGDGLGSTVAVTWEDGSIANSGAYDVFGGQRSVWTAATSNDYQFAGEQVDSSSGLQYLRARYYDSATGRFIGSDPFSEFTNIPASQNAYAYGMNNPALLVDPLGLFPPNPLGGTVGSVAISLIDKTKPIPGQQ